MDVIATRYAGLAQGRLHRKAKLDRDLRPGELRSAVARARDGDDVAMSYLYLRFSGNVFGYARSILRDEHEAEDVCQQVFARMLTALQSYEHRAVPFSAWLLRITHNLAIDHMRRRLTLCETAEAMPGAQPDEARSRELADALRDALQELPEGQRRVVGMRHLAGIGPGEIAWTLDRSEDSVHALHHRGRRALRKGLERRGAAPQVAAS